jgi:hypothetical protein
MRGDGTEPIADVVGIELDLQAALAAVDEDLRLGQRRSLDRRRYALLLAKRTDAPTRYPVRRSASAGRIIFAALPPNAAASFFMLTSLSEGTMTQTGLPSTSAINVLSTRRGSTPMASAA